LAAPGGRFDATNLARLKTSAVSVPHFSAPAELSLQEPIFYEGKIALLKKTQRRTELQFSRYLSFEDSN